VDGILFAAILQIVSNFDSILFDLIKTTGKFDKKVLIVNNNTHQYESSFIVYFLLTADNI
jgi:hypothetical protein